jgi:hypothetical protein
LDALLVAFAQADTNIRLQHILRLFVVVRSRMDKEDDADEAEGGAEEGEEGIKIEDEGNQNNVAGSAIGLSSASTRSLTDEEVRSNIIAVARRVRSTLPEIWTRGVAKRFGGVLRMFKSRGDGNTSNPPSPCRASVRGIDYSVQ